MNDKVIHRCLKPSLTLYIVIGTVILFLCGIIFLICKSFGWALIIAAGLGASPLVLVSPVAHQITKSAEYKMIQPNKWFSVDHEKEKLRYGPLRAGRRANKYGS